MLRTASLPFIVQRSRSEINASDYITTVERLQGLLHLEGDVLQVQWRTTLEVTQYGGVNKSDRDIKPLREVAIPLIGLAGARIKRVWKSLPPREAVVLTASNLQAFVDLSSENDLPGLVLEHPAEVILNIRRADKHTARSFVSALNLAVSEIRLSAFDDEPGAD